MVLLGKRYKKDKKTIKGTFTNAFEGIVYAFNTEVNIRIHVLLTVLVIISSYIFEVELWEFIVCLILIALVISLELVNTVAEVIVDMVEPKYNPLAKIAKDTAAGAVLVMATTSGIIGMIIFIPKVLEYIGLF